VPLEGQDDVDNLEVERFECPKCGEGAQYRDLVEELERYIEESSAQGSESLPQSAPRFILR
jgi:transcription initiation factor IIE alpha subunit